jgi:excisionase family DNA binding protein
MPIKLPRKRGTSSVNAPIPSQHANVDLLTVKQAVAMAKVSDPTIRRWIASGQLPAFKLGAQVRIDRAELLKLLQPWSPNRAL